MRNLEDQPKQSYHNHKGGLIDSNRSTTFVFISICLAWSIFLLYFFHNPYMSYIPLLLITIIGWRRSLPRERRSYYGLCRLIFYVLFVSFWSIFILRAIFEGTVLLIGYRPLDIDKLQHLFPYSLLLINFILSKSDLHMNDHRRYLLHVLHDIPTFFLVVLFKLLRHPFNSLYSEITEHCYLGSLPLPNDVQTLKGIGIEYIVNMCAEYGGPRQTYEQFNMKQLHLPTVDSIPPSLRSIEQAVQFIREAQENNQKVFVHCKAGIGRSAAIVLCHLVANEKMSPEEAFKLMKQKRPEVSMTIIHFSTVKQYFLSLKKNTSS